MRQHAINYRRLNPGDYERLNRQPPGPHHPRGQQTADTSTALLARQRQELEVLRLQLLEPRR